MQQIAQTQFADAIAKIVTAIGERPLDADLEVYLNETVPPDGAPFRELETLVAAGVAQGWLCGREGGGIKYGRAIKPGAGAGRFSVDVVEMENLKGPHHVHTTGEIGMILPVSGEPRFDGKERGWYVYPPSSSHWPTVAGGTAVVLYLLPDGAIEFTGK